MKTFERQLGLRGENHARCKRPLFRLASIPFLVGVGIWLVFLPPVGAQDATLGKRGALIANSGAPYLQQVHTPYSVQNGLPSDEILNVVASEKEIFAATPTGIARWSESAGWQKFYSSDEAVVCIATGNQDAIWFATPTKLLLAESNKPPRVVAVIASGIQPACIAVADKNCFVGTNRGVWVVQDEKLVPVQTVNDLLNGLPAVKQLAHQKGELIVAAAGGLVSYSMAARKAIVLEPRDEEIGWALRDVRGVAFDSQGSLWFAAPQGCGVRSANQWKLFSKDSLPWNDFTCVAAAQATAGVWFGTKKGALRFDGARWEYRQGPRWLLSDQVNSIAIRANDAWLGTSGGMSRIEARPMTLEQKSRLFNEVIDRKHKRTSFGYVDAITLKSPEDDSSWTQHDSDNDGLWTSMYGAAQCFEYAATRSPEARRRASDAFRAVAFLSEVTQGGQHSPPKGFPARSILPTDGFDPNSRDNEQSDRRRIEWDPLWKILSPRWPVSKDGKWYWKTDTSSDELDGHFFLYSIYFDLVAETVEEKRYAAEVVDRVTSHLLENHYCLVDHDGRPTRWGQFSPDVLNTDKLTDCRGLNSLSLLSYLLVAEHVTGNPKYRRAYEMFMNEHNYFTNVLTPKFQTGPGSGNQSDDEMAFMCYYNAMMYEKEPRYRKQYMRSMARYFSQEQSEACPLFNYVFARFWEPLPYYWQSVPQSILDEAHDTLKRIPLDRRQWAFQNSHRLDVVPLGDHILVPKGRGHLRNGKVVPIDERNINHWNQDPWKLDGNGTGHELADGASFLLPYWMGVHFGFVQR